MNPWFGKATFLATFIGYCVIRTPHGNRSKTMAVIKDQVGALEKFLLLGALLGTTIVPFVWVVTHLFSFADYTLRIGSYSAGVILTALGLWIFYRSHADLGTNWSVSLQVRENHRLVTSGIYRSIRHPMYTAMFMLGVAQLFFIPNWVAGPAYLVGFGLLYVFRVGTEERMMIEKFGPDYTAYMQRSGRLLPRGVRASS